MNDNKTDFDTGIMDEMVKKSMTSYLTSLDGAELIQLFLEQYEQDNRLYSKLYECQEKTPEDFVKNMGVPNKKNKNFIEWLDMIITVLGRAATMNEIEMSALSDMETQEPEAYRKIIEYRKKWADGVLGDCSPPKLFPR